VKQNIKVSFLIALVGCTLLASATPCTPALARQLPHVMQCLLACLPLGAIFLMAPKAGKGKEGGKSKKQKDEEPDEETDEEGVSSPSKKKHKRGPARTTTRLYT